MAYLLFDDGGQLNDLDAIAGILTPLSIAIGHDPDPLPVEIQPLISVANPDGQQREAILKSLDGRLERLGIVEPLVSRDLLNLHADSPGTAEHLNRFCGFHTHGDDEGRYIIAGECLFGFALPSSQQLRLTLHPGDLLRIPAGTEHWFHLTPLHQLKAVRLFSHVKVWVTTTTTRAITASLAV